MRGRRLSALIVAGLLALAGCGGDDASAPEVPGPPADVVIPEASVAPASAASGQNGDTGGTSSGSSATDDTGSATTDETAPTDTTAPDTSGGGTTAPETQADSPANDTPPPEGSDAEQFEDFCAQNPGAC